MPPAAPNQTQQMLDELSKYVIAEPYPFVLDLEKSHGSFLATIDGREIFDWAGYFGAKLIAHNHPGLSEPDYLKNLILAANNKTANPDFLTPQCLDFYRLLHDLAPKSMRNPRLEVYAVNSGAEAVENMMKYFINLYHQKLKKAGKTPVAGRFIHFDQAFHGRTILRSTSPSSPTIPSSPAISTASSPATSKSPSPSSTPPDPTSKTNPPPNRALLRSRPS